ncbi:MAG: amino acid decarboxylase, partial [Oscillospiraceae bacterium]|nr:amino acid decarboxylase [Oscillospiraceae bacterium]
NAHKTFLSAAILLDFPIRWLWAGEDYLSCPVTPEQVEQAILEEGEKPFAVYLTSPDYLGNMADIRGISGVCRKYGVRLLVDNAHGAYLKFLPESRHPMDLGADLCCDSAHKTLPVLTGGAYLHFREEGMRGKVKDAMALFGSTSPSYLIMQSLDRANPYLEGLPQRLRTFAPWVSALKDRLLERGLTLGGEEPLKLTWMTRPWGYSGTEIAEILEKKNLICEFQDERHIVFMFTPENDPWELEKLSRAICQIPRREALTDEARQRVEPKAACSPRQAVFGERERIPVGESAGRILANLSVSCPPAVPIIMCGEEIEEAIIPRLRALGWAFVEVVK